jgi:hypothetical protein
MSINGHIKPDNRCNYMEWRMDGGPRGSGKVKRKETTAFAGGVGGIFWKIIGTEGTVCAVGTKEAV